SDVNVFDIEQGVSINFFVKTGTKKPTELGRVFHYDLYGKRDVKYDFLIENSLKTTPYTELKTNLPNLFFTSKDFGNEEAYSKGFSIPQLFPLSSLGLLTKRDNLSVDFDIESLERKVSFFLDEAKSVNEVCSHFKLVIKDKDKWDAIQTRVNVSKGEIKQQIRDVLYRPFDNRKVLYNTYFVARPNTKVLRHFAQENIGLIICRQGQAVGGNDWNVVFACKYLTDQNIYRRGGGTIFPLYLYRESSGQASFEDQEERVPNLNMEIVDKIGEDLNLYFSPERPDYSQQTEETNQFYPEDILDYIYAVLHSPAYRDKYKEFLKIDFPRIPYPTSSKTFFDLV